LNFRLSFPELCDRCGGPGHWGSRCEHTPEASHRQLIQTLVDLWVDQKIGIEEKRAAISEENKRYYGAACPAHLKWPH
jgi:hypothetical protein